MFITDVLGWGLHGRKACPQKTILGGLGNGTAVTSRCISLASLLFAARLEFENLPRFRGSRMFQILVDQIRLEEYMAADMGEGHGIGRESCYEASGWYSYSTWLRAPCVVWNVRGLSGNC